MMTSGRARRFQNNAELWRLHLLLPTRSIPSRISISIILSIILSTFMLSGCKKRDCEKRSAEAQIEIRLENLSNAEVFTTSVELNINGADVFSHTFPTATPIFVFEFKEYDQAPRELSIKARAVDEAGNLLGAGESQHVFSPDGCNLFVATIVGGKRSDAGPDGPGLDAGPDSPRRDMLLPIGDGANPTTYECQDPLDEYNSQRHACVRKNLTCNAVTLCPNDDYYCVGESCVCDNYLVCGYSCITSNDCPTDWVCHKGACREPAPCMDDDSMCPLGKECRWLSHDELPSWSPSALTEFWRCFTPSAQSGTLDPGQPCIKDADCKSNLCETSICLQRCTKNDDCPGALYCVLQYSHEGDFACVAQTPCDACVAPEKSCNEMLSLIIGAGEGCIGPPCKVTSDCLGTDCVYHDDASYRMSICTGESTDCTADEVQFGYLTTYCAVHTACYDNSACSTGYSCVKLYELSGSLSSPELISGFCARAVP